MTSWACFRPTERVLRDAEAAGQDCYLLTTEESFVHHVAALVGADGAGAGQSELPGAALPTPLGHARETRQRSQRINADQTRKGTNEITAVEDKWD